MHTSHSIDVMGLMYEVRVCWYVKLWESELSLLCRIRSWLIWATVLTILLTFAKHIYADASVGYLMHYCLACNTCSSIAKTRADALSHYWGHLHVGRQINKAAVCAIAHRKWQCINTVQLLGVCSGASSLVDCSVALAFSFSWVSGHSPPDLLHILKSHVD